MMSESTKCTLNRKGWISIVLLTVVFVAAFFGLRALPDAECGFLHYVEIVNEDGEIELCATNHAGYIDLTRLTYPVRAELSTESELRPGVSQLVELELLTDGGMNIAPHELAVTHTEKMHVMVIDPSLEDYHHLHPEAEGISGLYHFDFIPQRAGVYRVFTEVVPNLSRRQAIALSSLEVAGEANEPSFERCTLSEVDGLRFELSNVPDALKTGRDYRFILDVSDLAGAAIELETVMGAKGHMVAFDGARRGFAHMHPEDSVAATRSAGLSGSGSEQPELAFLFNVPNPGWYRLFAQIQVDGAPVFGRFDLKVD